MSIVKIEKDLEFEKDLLDILIKHSHIPKDRKTLVKKADLTVYGDKPMKLEVVEKDE